MKNLAANLIVSFGKEAEIQLFRGLKEAETEEIAPIKTEIQGEKKSFFYSLAPGKYRCMAKCPGLYSYRENFCFTQEDLDAVVHHTFPEDPMKGEGFEPTAAQHIRIPVREAFDRLAPDWDDRWEEDSFIYGTPVFTSPDHARHSITTHEEMLAYVEELSQKNPEMKKFDLFTSPRYGHTVPLLIFSSTDLSEVKSPKEAADVLRGNGRPTVYHQAQIHGNEPAGGEGALVMATYLSSPAGKKLLEKLNVVILPRINPDGAHDYIRNSPSTGDNLNRDFLHLANVETAAAAKTFALFLPEVVIDGHEYTYNIETEKGYYPDMMLGTGFTLNNDAAYTELGVDMIGRMFRAFEEKGLTHSYYTGLITSNNFARGNKYYGAQGALAILVESRGIWYGQNKFRRRLMGQFTAARTILETVAANPETYREAAAKERSRLAAQAGKPFVLKSTHSKEGAGVRYHHSAYVDLTTGEVLHRNDRPGYLLDTVLASRPRPNEYVLPLGEAWEEQVIGVLNRQSIAYRREEGPFTATLQRYEGGCKEATLSEPTEYTWEKGALIVPVNQITSNLISALFEPDCIDVEADAGTLSQWGTLPAENGLFPIYRR